MISTLHMQLKEFMSINITAHDNRLLLKQVALDSATT